MTKATAHDRLRRRQRRFAELYHREVRRANLDRLGNLVLRSTAVAGDTPLPDEWKLMLEKLNEASEKDAEHLVVVLWRFLCDLSLKMAEEKSNRRPTHSAQDRSNSRLR